MSAKYVEAYLRDTPPHIDSRIEIPAFYIRQGCTFVGG